MRKYCIFAANASNNNNVTRVTTKVAIDQNSHTVCVSAEIAYSVI